MVSSGDTLQAGIETARVPLDELTPHAQKLTPLLTQWHHAGLTRDASTCVRLTNEGRFWASNILQSLDELIQALNAPRIAVEQPYQRVNYEPCLFTGFFEN